MFLSTPPASLSTTVFLHFVPAGCNFSKKPCVSSRQNGLSFFRCAPLPSISLTFFYILYPSHLFCLLFFAFCDSGRRGIILHCEKPILLQGSVVWSLWCTYFNFIKVTKYTIGVTKIAYHYFMYLDRDWCQIVPSFIGRCAPLRKSIIFQCFLHGFAFLSFLPGFIT